jgi:glycosyltransferase involved in cell wall biosynthesis
MKKIRVLHYLRNLDLGGTTKTCQLFFEHATSSDFDVIVAFERTGDHTRFEEFQKATAVCGGRLTEIDSYKFGAVDPSGEDLQSLIDTYDVDICHVYRSGFSEFPVPGKDIHVPHFVETNVFGFVDQNPKVEKSLFMSKWLMDHTLRGITHPRFDFVNNPVEMPYTDARISGLSSEAIWLGRCGRPDNGIYNSVSVDAARLLRMQGHDVRFLVVAPPSNMINDLVEYEIPFKVIEPTTNPLVLSQFYNSVDIYAHARADGETFGVNIAEAMIHGKPVVTHVATPSHPGMGVFQSQTELVDDGQTGFIVSNDPAEYAEALGALIESQQLRESFGYYAIVKATKEYHVDACVAKLEKIYREIADE